MSTYSSNCPVRAQQQRTKRDLATPAVVMEMQNDNQPFEEGAGVLHNQASWGGASRVHPSLPAVTSSLTVLRCLLMCTMSDMQKKRSTTHAVASSTETSPAQLAVL